MGVSTCPGSTEFKRNPDAALMLNTMTTGDAFNRLSNWSGTFLEGVNTWSVFVTIVYCMLLYATGMFDVPIAE